MIIFTANINAYDNIPDHFYDGDVKYVMFYDKEIPRKGPWEFRKLDCQYEHPVLNAYHTRCLSHLWFDEPPPFAPVAPGEVPPLFEPPGLTSYCSAELSVMSAFGYHPDLEAFALSIAAS